MKTLKLPTVQATAKLAQQIAQILKGGEVLALSGPLGSGKTTFVQFLAKTLGVKRMVRSPSFVILQLFNLPPASCPASPRLPPSLKLRRTSRGASKLQAKLLCHVDCYRLKSADGLDALGLYDYLGKPNVITVIEWAEKIKKVLPPKTIWLKFEYTKDGRSVDIHFPNQKNSLLVAVKM